MRVGLYARVSTKDQSCDMQLRDLRAYCAARQLTISREYVDAGVSGTKGLAAAIERAHGRCPQAEA